MDYITVSLISVVDGESEIGSDTAVNLPKASFSHLNILILMRYEYI